MSQGIVKRKDQAKVFLDDQEVCREYFRTEKITFGMSELLPGAVGGLDKGHTKADEIFFCVEGNVLCYFPEEDIYHELNAGDALLIPPGNGHKLFNIGQSKAIITWSCAPHQ